MISLKTFLGRLGPVFLDWAGYTASHSARREVEKDLARLFNRLLARIPKPSDDGITFHVPFEQAVPDWDEYLVKPFAPNNAGEPRRFEAYWNKIEADLDDPKQALSSTPLKQIFELTIPISIPHDVRVGHQWFCGTTRTGKTSFFEYQLHQDFDRVARDECSVMVVEPKGTFSERIGRLKRFAPGGDLHGKLVYLEPDPDHPLALSPFDPGPLKGVSDKERAVIKNDAFMQFSYVLSGIGTEMTALQSTPFYQALSFCARLPEPTISTLYQFLLPNGEKQYENEIAKLDEDTRAYFRHTWNDQNARTSRNGVIAKLQTIMSGPASALFKPMFSAPRTKIDLFEQTTENCRVVVLNTDENNLRKGSEVLGAYFISLLYLVVLRRYNLMLRTRKKLKPLWVYIDEAGSYIGKHPEAELLFTKAGEAGVHLIVANQTMGQFSTSMKSAVMNTATRFINSYAEVDHPILRTMLGGSRDTPIKLPFLTYAASIPPATRPIQITVPHLMFEAEPQMSDKQFAAIRADMQNRFCWNPRAGFSPAPTASEPAPQREFKRRERKHKHAGLPPKPQVDLDHIPDP